jgi:hypothetical protein
MSRLRPGLRISGMSTRAVFIAAALLAVAAPPAIAQSDPRTDVAVGVVGYRNFDAVMRGWNVQWSVPLDWRWGAIVEVAAAQGANAEPGEHSFRDFAGLAGIRYSRAQTPRLVPFWQVLAGGVIRERSGHSCDPAGRCVAADESMLRGAVQSGVGLVFMFNPRVGVRAQADLQVLLLPGLVAGFPRATFGGVVRLGR